MTESGLRHRRTIEVSWGDCDAAGVVFYPNYYAWFDACTHSMLKAAGLDHHQIREAYGVIGTPLVETSARFLSPSRYDDVLTATSHVSHIGVRSFTVEHELSLEDRVVVQGKEVRVWAEESTDAPHGIRTCPIPDAVRRVLEGQSDNGEQ